MINSILLDFNWSSKCKILSFIPSTIKFKFPLFKIILMFSCFSIYDVSSSILLSLISMPSLSDIKRVKAFWFSQKYYQNFQPNQTISYSLIELYTLFLHSQFTSHWIHRCCHQVFPAFQEPGYHQGFWE